MKFLVVLAVAVACVAADVSHIVKSDDYAAPIVRSNYDSSPEGNFQYSYETGNGIVAQAEGVVNNRESDQPSLLVRGSYSYYSPDGTPIQTEYVAGEQGFQATGSHIPVPPPIPELILRSLAYIESHRPAVEKVYNKP